MYEDSQCTCGCAGERERMCVSVYVRVCLYVCVALCPCFRLLCCSVVVLCVCYVVCVARVGMLLMDEVHVVPAHMFRKVLDKTQVSEVVCGVRVYGRVYGRVCALACFYVCK